MNSEHAFYIGYLIKDIDDLLQANTIDELFYRNMCAIDTYNNIFKSKRLELLEKENKT